MYSREAPATSILKRQQLTQLSEELDQLSAVDPRFMRGKDLGFLHGGLGF
jgi:hypothetical protein